MTLATEEELLDSVIALLRDHYYPGHETTSQRVIDRHLLRAFGYTPRESVFYGARVTRRLKERGMIEPAPEDRTRHTLLRVNLRRLEQPVKQPVE